MEELDLSGKLVATDITLASPAFLEDTAWQLTRVTFAVSHGQEALPRHL